MNDQLNFNSIVNLALRFWKTLFAVAIVAAIAATIFSSEIFLTPKFNSVGVVYPVNLKPFSDESETEQLLQYFQNNAIRDSVVNKFNLLTYFDLDTSESGWKYNLGLLYDEHVSIGKTQYESIKIEVLHESPDTARLICNEIIHQVNEFINRQMNAQAVEQAESYSRQLKDQRLLIDSLTANMSRLSRDSNVLQYDAQVREITRGYFTLLAQRGSSSNEAKEARQMLENVENNGASALTYQRMNELMQNNYELLYREFSRYKKMASERISYTMTVIEPDTPDKKAWPVRWLILVVAVVSSVLAALIVLLIRNQNQ